MEEPPRASIEPSLPNEALWLMVEPYKFAAPLAPMLPAAASVSVRLVSESVWVPLAAPRVRPSMVVLVSSTTV